MISHETMFMGAVVAVLLLVGGALHAALGPVGWLTPITALSLWWWRDVRPGWTRHRRLRAERQLRNREVESRIADRQLRAADYSLALELGLDGLEDLPLLDMELPELWRDEEGDGAWKVKPRLHVRGGGRLLPERPGRGDETKWGPRKGRPKGPGLVDTLAGVRPLDLERTPGAVMRSYHQARAELERQEALMRMEERYRNMPRGWFDA